MKAELQQMLNWKGSKVYWQMRNGEYIDVDKMSTEHLRNTLKMILRNREMVKHRQKIAKRELISRRVNDHEKFALNGDMAQEFNNTQFIDEDDESLGEIYNDLNFTNNSAKSFPETLNGK